MGIENNILLPSDKRSVNWETSGKSSENHFSSHYSGWSL